MYDCYFFVNTDLPPDSQTMAAMCTECHKANNFGWFWNGSKVGYGDYDLNCHFCKKILHQKIGKNEENSISDEKQQASSQPLDS